ncbi:MAG: GNAT family N-acetyltransferase [Anaerolineae bacterium]|nr:GNAT family N-acetyltransferase [Anaerolineae bacterium]
MVLVQPATQNDVPALAALNAHVHQLHAEAEPWFFKPPVGTDYFAAREQDFRAMLTDSAQTIWVARIAKADAVIGYLWAQRRDSFESAELFACKRLYINHISVHPDYFRQGVGEALMAAAKALARQQGANMALGVHAFNTRAQRFFAKQGFAPLIHTMWLANSE